jgi:hypothetical protein
MFKIFIAAIVLIIVGWWATGKFCHHDNEYVTMAREALNLKKGCSIQVNLE